LSESISVNFHPVIPFQYNHFFHNLNYSVTGHGSMGISNSIGSNTFNILLCLGLPWLIKCSFLPAVEGQHYVGIHSGGIGYSAVSLLSALFLLYATFLFSEFKLDRKVGVIFLFIYAVFLIMTALIELNTFFIVNLPVCGQGN